MFLSSGFCVVVVVASSFTTLAHVFTFQIKNCGDSYLTKL